MDAPHSPVDPRTLALLELKDRLQELHAQLEYVRLMLRLRDKAPG
jgi:hypothetical protein